MTFAPALPSGFRVRLPVFDGPLDLLLALIQRAALDITAVALAEVTDQFLRHVAEMDAVEPGALAEFIDTAATLLLIKSRALLPQPTEAVEAEDDAELLLERLREYKRYREAAEGLGRRERAGLRTFPRTAAPVDLPPPALSGSGSLEDLTAAFRDALAEAVRTEPPRPEPGIRPHPVRLVDRFDDLRAALLRGGSISFRQAVLGDRPPGASAREFVIVSFMALLELLRRNAVTVRQDELFGEIVIEALPALATVATPGEEGSFGEDDADARAGA